MAGRVIIDRIATTVALAAATAGAALCAAPVGASVSGSAAPSVCRGTAASPFGANVCVFSDRMSQPQVQSDLNAIAAQQVPIGGQFDARRYALLFEPGTYGSAARPLVFLNACGTDRPERTYTGLTDWAQKCFDAGAGAFVGSLWDVRSKPARAFATSFYRALLEDGQPLALAAHLARNEAWQQSSKDPTWLAYTVYGNPFARAVSAGALPPADVPLPQ